MRMISWRARYETSSPVALSGAGGEAVDAAFLSGHPASRLRRDTHFELPDLRYPGRGNAALRLSDDGQLQLYLPCGLRHAHDHPRAVDHDTCGPAAREAFLRAYGSGADRGVEEHPVPHGAFPRDEDRFHWWRPWALHAPSRPQDEDVEHHCHRDGGR